jgi:hypothetical protein
MKRRLSLAKTFTGVVFCGLASLPNLALASTPGRTPLAGKQVAQNVADPTPPPPPPAPAQPPPAPPPPAQEPPSATPTPPATPPPTEGSSPTPTPAPAPTTATPIPAPAPVPDEPPPLPPTAIGPSSVSLFDVAPAAPKKDATQALSAEERLKQSKDPFRGSTLLLDQSVTTQSLGIGATPLTYVPFYQLWLSLRPRFYITDHLIVSARIDYYKELTNSGTGDQGPTTDYREDDFGDIWTNLVYEGYVDKAERTKLNGGLRFLWGVSKESQGEGIPVQAGLTAGISHKVPLHDASAPFLNDVHFKAGAWYNHPFAEATTPSNPNFEYVRQNTDGQSVVTTQLAGTPLVDHQLLLSAEAGIQITPRVDFAVDFILINQWHYSAPGDQCVRIVTGVACPPMMNPGTTGPLNDQTYSELTWFILNLNWDALDQVSLGLGYFNLQNELSTEATNRTLGQLLWSPDARFFFDITANLDAIYDSIAPKKGALKEAAQRAREANFSQWSAAHF